MTKKWGQMIEAVVGAIVGAGIFSLVGVTVNQAYQIRAMSKHNVELILENDRAKKECEAAATREKEMLARQNLVVLTPAQVNDLGQYIAEAVKQHLPTKQV